MAEINSKILGDKVRSKKSYNTPKQNAKNPGSPGWTPVPFRYSTDRLSINKKIENVYSQKGTIYYSVTQESHKPRWNEYYDEKGKMIENHYEKAVNRVGDPKTAITKSELVQRLAKYPQILGDSSNNINSLNANNPMISPYANQTLAALEKFKSDSLAYIIRNALGGNFGPYESGMINDTKRKEMIDSVATNKPEQAKKYVNTNTTPNKKALLENSTKKYEDRYINNKDHLINKKIPDYGSGPTIKYDQYNALYTLPDKDNPSETLSESEKGWDGWDFIPFILHDIVNKKHLPFRSYINSLSDQSDAEWQQVRYVGRADNVQVYTGFTRNVSIDFTVVSFGVKELHPMWQRLNYLVGLTKPADYTNQIEENANIATGGFIIPPFLKLRLGDMYVDQPVVMTSVAINIPPEASWELTSDAENMEDGYEYLNGTFFSTKESNLLVAQYPNMAQVNISFIFLEKRLPKTNIRHFGHYASENGIQPEDAKGDDGPEIDRGFNYNLIYPNPARKFFNPFEGLVGSLEGEPDEDANEPDPFEGTDNPACTTYPPSKYYISRKSGIKKNKKDSRYEADLKMWKECACKNTAILMEEEELRSCQWDGNCIQFINGKRVPESLRCAYTMEFNSEPVEEDDDTIEPPICAYQIGGFNEKNENGDLIGYDEKELYDSQDEEYLKQLNLRNLNLWIREVADYVADEIGQSHIGSGPYNYTVKRERGYRKISEPLRRKNIRTVHSSTGRITMEFGENSNLIEYNGQKLTDEKYTKFKVSCGEEEREEIREIAGNIQPVIIANKNEDTWLRLDNLGNSSITKNNYRDKNAVRRLLADFVSRELGTKNYKGGTNVINKYGDLASMEGTAIENDEIYYIPYEEDKTKMIKGYKVFPGTSEYVYYDYEDDLEGRLRLTEGSPDLVELKLGFYAIVSRTKEKLSSTSLDIQTEDELADILWERLFDYNKADNDKITFEIPRSINLSQRVLDLSAISKTNTILEFESSDPNIASTFPNGFNKGVLALKKGGTISVTAREVTNQSPPLNGKPAFITRGIQIIDDVGDNPSEAIDPSYLDISGGPLVNGEPYKGIAGDGFESDEEMIEELDPSDVGRFQREKDRLEQVMAAEENNIKPQLANPKVPVLNYRIIGQWTNPQQQEILERMIDMDYQPIIAEKYNTGSSRIAIENYLLILLGTTEDDIETADNEYRDRANKGTLIRANPKREDEINIDYLKKRIEDQEFFIKDKEKKIADGEIPRNEGLTNQGIYFENKTSQGHFEPWVRDHQLEKIEWVNQSWRNPPTEPIVSNVESPKPTTDTPTPNRQPTWTWQPIKDATVYEVIFQDITTLTHDTYFKSPSRLARNKEYTILVKAGIPNQSGTGTDWSVSGRHTVKIDKNALPPKPPKCPYAVGFLNEKDQYGRLIGLLFENQPLDMAIERNVKMWCGDVMAYITAKEDVGSLTFPCDPNNVQKNKVGNFGFATTYEQSKMVWSEMSTFTGPYGKEISPTNLNGNFLGDNESLTYTYEGVFDLNCGPTIFNPTDGGEVTAPPEIPLDTPKPNSEKTTNNPKPEWQWEEIKEATVYRVSLEKINYSANESIRIEEDYGVISYSELTKATPLFNLKEGLYRVSVIAEKKENEKVVKKSEPGYHVVSVENPKPITELSTPKPNSRTPTSDKTIIWKWEAIANATKYKVELNKVVKSTNVATGEDSWNIDTELGELQDSTSLEFKFDASVDGNFEITVIAYNNELESEPGRHVVEFNSELTPTPTSKCEDFPKPTERFLSDPDLCAFQKRVPNYTEKDIKGFRDPWREAVGKYLGCKRNIDVYTAKFNYTIFNDVGRCVKVAFDGEETFVEYDRENTFYINKGTALEGRERELYYEEKYIPQWNDPLGLGTREFSAKMVVDPKLTNCPEKVFIPNKVRWKGKIYVGQTVGFEPILSAATPDDPDYQAFMPEFTLDKMNIHQRKLSKYPKGAPESYNYYGRWWLTEEEHEIVVNLPEASQLYVIP